MNPGRQTRLAEIGTAGQEKLSRAKVRLRSIDSRARDIERRYLEGAGITIDEVADATSEPLAHAGARDLARAHESAEKQAFHEHLDVASFSEFPSARIVAEGARNALAAVREILELR